MEQIIGNPWLQAMVVLISQVLFLYFRTLNIKYIAQKRVLPAIVSGNCIGLLWLVTVAFGAKALLDGELLTVLAQLLGGSIGTYFGVVGKKDK